jgi:hypothetical protein
VAVIVASQKTTGSNMDVVLAALYLLGGATQLVHVEDIALKAYDLAPTRFSWTRHPEYPDLSVAREGLYDAYRANRRGSRLVRRTKKGTEWALTAEGVAFVRTDARAWIETKPEPARAVDYARQEVQRVVREVIDHPAYGSFLKARRISTVPRHQIADLLRVSLDSEPDKVRERVERLRAAARDAGRADLEAFVTAAGERLLTQEVAR